MSSFTKAILISEIGQDLYDRVDKVAEKETALALKMDLMDKWKQPVYYKRKYLLQDLLEESKLFSDKNIKFSPLDLVNILFRSKVLFASKTDEEYSQRTGGGLFLGGDEPFDFRWQERVFGINKVVDEHIDRLYKSIKENTLVTEISHFRTLIDIGMGNPTDFFEDLFKKLNLPYKVFFDDDKLIEKYKTAEPYLKTHELSVAKSYYCSPSIGYTTIGSQGYLYTYGSAWLRNFLNMLRIGGFIHHGQMDFGFNNIQLMAPTGSVILGTRSMGGLSWDEDTKLPWLKIPDGCLFRSFGYRGLSDMYLDNRTFAGIEKFFIENKIIFDHLKNPWEDRTINDIEPTLDILSSTTQIPDLGAKILLLYCCLEHLFVPKNIIKDNKKYIVGGINALKPALLPWFDRLYKVRCDYAHRGYVIKDDKTMSLIFESISNVFLLLTLKLK